MKKTLAILVLSVSSQAFGSATLNEAFAHALKSSESDHKNQQVVLSVSPDQIEKATFKRVHKVETLKAENNMMTDITVSPIAAPDKEEQPKDNDDFARLNSEMNNI